MTICSSFIDCPNVPAFVQMKLLKPCRCKYANEASYKPSFKYLPKLSPGTKQYMNTHIHCTMQILAKAKHQNTLEAPIVFIACFLY